MENHSPREVPIQLNQAHKSLRDYAMPTLDMVQGNIGQLKIVAKNFEIKSIILLMLQSTIQFRKILFRD